MACLSIKYLDRELSIEEKSIFLQEATNDEIQKKELITDHHIVAHLSLLSRDEDKINAEKKLLIFFEKLRKDKISNEDD